MMEPGLGLSEADCLFGSMLKCCADDCMENGSDYCNPCQKLLCTKHKQLHDAYYRMFGGPTANEHLQSADIPNQLANSQTLIACQSHGKAVTHACVKCYVLICSQCFNENTFGGENQGCKHEIKTVDFVAEKIRSELNSSLSLLQSQHQKTEEDYTILANKNQQHSQYNEQIIDLIERKIQQLKMFIENLGNVQKHQVVDTMSETDLIMEQIGAGYQKYYQQYSEIVTKYSNLLEETDAALIGSYPSCKELRDKVRVMPAFEIPQFEPPSVQLVETGSAEVLAFKFPYQVQVFQSSFCNFDEETTHNTESDQLNGQMDRLNGQVDQLNGQVDQLNGQVDQLTFTCPDSVNSYQTVSEPPSTPSPASSSGQTPRSTDSGESVKKSWANIANSAPVIKPQPPRPAVSTAAIAPELNTPIHPGARMVPCEIRFIQPKKTDGVCYTAAYLSKGQLVHGGVYNLTGLDIKGVTGVKQGRIHCLYRHKNRLYIMQHDSKTNRLHIINTANGQLIKANAVTYQNEENRLNSVAANDTHIFIAMCQEHCVRVYDLAFKRLPDIGRSVWDFLEPRGVATVPDGGLLVTDYRGDTVTKFHYENRTATLEWVYEGIPSPTRMAVDEIGQCIMVTTLMHKFMHIIAYDGVHMRKLKIASCKDNVTDITIYKSQLAVCFGCRSTEKESLHLYSVLRNESPDPNQVQVSRNYAKQGPTVKPCQPQEAGKPQKDAGKTQKDAGKSQKSYDTGKPSKPQNGGAKPKKPEVVVKTLPNPMPSGSKPDSKPQKLPTKKQEQNST